MACPRLPPEPPPGAARGRRGLVLAVLALVIYNTNLRVIVEGDSRPARLQPLTLWRAGTLTLDPLADLATAVPPNRHYQQAYWLRRGAGGHLLSVYPVVTPVLLAPLYAPVAAELWLRGWDSRRVALRALQMEKLAASLVCALSVGLFYRLLRRQLGRPDATLLALAYAFGTGTWPISSQALWQHGMGELVGVAALLGATGLAAGGTAPVDAAPAAGAAATGAAAAGGLASASASGSSASSVSVSSASAGGVAASGPLASGASAPAAAAGGTPATGPPPSRRAAGRGAALLPWLLLLGAAAGLMTANRPPDGLLAVPLLGWSVLAVGWRAWPALGAALAAAAPAAWYNLRTFGHLAGGYAAIGLAGPHPFYRHSMLTGALGLLASPAKGLLLFSPFCLWLPFSLGVVWRRGSRLSGTSAAEAPPACPRPPARALALAVAGACLAQLLFYGMSDWRGGACYGPRFLADAMPFWVWLLAPALPRLRAGGRRWFVTAVAVAALIQAVGAFCYPMGGSDDLYYPHPPPRAGRAAPAHGGIPPQVWSPGSAAFLIEARGGLAPPQLLPGRLRALWPPVRNPG